MVGKCFGGVFFAKEGQEGKEFEKGAWPAVEEGEGDGRWILREEGGEVDFVSGVVVVDYMGIERRERGNASFFLTPVTL